MYQPQSENSKSGGIHNIEFANKGELFKAYMPFVKNGGLFVPTRKPFNLDDEIFLVLSLPEETEKLAVSCKVVWITPIGAQGNRTPGIGVQFRDTGEARSKIESILGGALKSEDPTLTM